MLYTNKKVLALTIVILLCAVAYAGFSDNVEVTGFGWRNFIFGAEDIAVDTAPTPDSRGFEDSLEPFSTQPATENMFEKCVIVCGDNLAFGPHVADAVYTLNNAGQGSNFAECKQTATNSPDRSNFNEKRERTKCENSLIDEANKDTTCGCYNKDSCWITDFTWVLERNKEGFMEYVKCQGIVVCPR